MKMKHADIQWEQPAPKGHGFSLFLWVMVLLFIAFVLVMAYAALTWKAPTSPRSGKPAPTGNSGGSRANVQLGKRFSLRSREAAGRGMEPAAGEPLEPPA